MIWRSTKISQAVSIQMGQSPSSEYYNSDGIGLPFFQGKADFTGKVPRVRKWCSQPIRIAREGDILLSVRAPVGPTNIAPSECCIGRGLAGLRAIDSLMLQQYLWYFLKYAEPTLSSKGQGAIFSAVSRSDIGSLSIPLPPLSEQQRIIDILDQADTIRKMKAEADEKIHRVLPALFYKMFGDITINNKGWDIKPLREFGAKIRYGLGQPPISRAKGLALIRATNISRGVISEENLVYVNPADVPPRRNAILKEDEVIVVRSGAYTGDAARISSEWSGCVAGYDLIITPGKNLKGDFVESYLLTDSIQKGYFSGLKTRAGQPHLNSDQLSSTPFPVVPYSMQCVFSERASIIQDLKKKYKAQKETIEKMYQILLHRSFSGELTAKWREAHMKELLHEMDIQSRELGLPVPDEEDRPIRISHFPNPLLEKKAILLAYIILRSHEAKHQIARVKLAKQYYFVNHLMEHPVTETFQAVAAGPLDNDIFPALELAQDRKWIVIEPLKGNEKPLSAGVCIDETDNLAVDILGQEKVRVDWFLEITKHWGWETLERWATVHSASIALQKAAKQINVTQLKAYIKAMPSWEAKLKRSEFSDHNIEKTVRGLEHFGLLTLSRRLS